MPDGAAAAQPPAQQAGAHGRHAPGAGHAPHAGHAGHAAHAARDAHAARGEQAAQVAQYPALVQYLQTLHAGSAEQVARALPSLTILGFWVLDHCIVTWRKHLQTRHAVSAKQVAHALPPRHQARPESSLQLSPC